MSLSGASRTKWRLPSIQSHCQLKWPTTGISWTHRTQSRGPRGDQSHGFVSGGDIVRLSDDRRTLFDAPWTVGNEVLLATLAEIGLPNRLVKSMGKAGVVLVGEFVQLAESALLRREGLGRNSIREAKSTLAKYGLHLGTKLWAWDTLQAHAAREVYGRKIQKKVFQLNPEEWCKCGSLERELAVLLRLVEDNRNVELLCQLYGFDEVGPKTLEKVGQQFGLTRERVRQIAARAEKKLISIWRPMNNLDAAKALLFSRFRRAFAPEEFAGAVRQAGISHIDFHVEGLLKALDLVGEPHRISNAQIGGTTLYGTADELSQAKSLIKIVRRETSANGCTNIHRLALLMGWTIDDASQVRELLCPLNEVYWLDNGKDWLLSSRPTRNRLANVATRIFSVADSVEISELRAALLRPTRVNIVPPEGPLSQFIEYQGIATVRNRTATVEQSLAKVEIGKNDLALALAFEELGSPATREQLEEYCLDNLGMNTNSFYVCLSYSPLVVKLATGIFSLVGHDVAPGAVDQVKAELKHRQFEASFGWSKVGTLWWHFQLDRPTLHAGAHAVPSFVLNLTSGDWTAKTVDALEVGLAKVDGGFISGLKLVFSILGASNRDYVQFDFDIPSRSLFVRIVGDEPEEFSHETPEDEFDEEVIIEEDE